MNQAVQARHDRAARLADPDGMIMVSVDHRESLRTMMAGGLPPGSVPDSTLSAFKTSAVRALAPRAGAVLVDPQYGRAAMAARAGVARLIVSADVLVQDRGGPVRGSELNEAVDGAYVRSTGADALKLLVIWRRGDAPASRSSLVSSFVERCAAYGVVSLVEGLARPDTDDWSCAGERQDAVLAAAEDLCAAGPDIYKAEVPGYVPGDLSAVEEQARQMDTAVGGPWVVLSSGVRASDFPVAVEAACRGGAGGFLAGRALWGDLIGSGATGRDLHTTAAARLDACRAAVVRGRSLTATAQRGGPRGTR